MMIKKTGIIGCFLFVLACKKNGNDAPPPPGGDPNGGGNPPPANTALTITSVSPDSTENGPITITGTGFNTTANLNGVQFGSYSATVKSATTTQLVVDLPANLPQGDHDVIVVANNKTVTLVKGFHLIGWEVTHFAGTGATGSHDGPVATATFRQPTGLAVDAAGNLYVPDLHKIRKITPQGLVSTIAGGEGRGSTDGNGTAARFNFVSSIVLDAAGNMYVADQMNFTIRKITPGGDVTTIAGLAGEFGYADGVGDKARFSAPYGLAIDATNSHLYVGDTGNDRIRKIELATGTVTTIAGNGEGASVDGVGLQAGIPSPGSMAFDKDGVLYITEKGGGRVRRMMPDGTVTTVGGYLSVNDGPTHLVADDNRNIYVTFSGLGKVKKYSPAGVETNFAGNNIGTGEEDGPAQTIFFKRPEGIVIVKDSEGNLIFYIADSVNKKIKKIIRR